ncbi:MAG: alpha-amylase family glycosyl hydrolase, partial [Verrucomicrobiota bacterium]|nr:alpha-amylase family glycosyl hydrolase [Verrucomicrobiota bacterium]
ERVYSRTPGYDNSPPESDGRRLWKMLALFQATYVGAPMIYYGTEVGMWGADDPEDRMPTWWHRMDDEIFKAYQMPLQLRNQNAALRRGEFEVLETRDDSQIFIFERRLGQQRVVVILNRGQDDFIIDDTSINGLDQLYSTDPLASALCLPRLSGAIFGTKK